MKIIDFYELAKQPKGTIFAEWDEGSHGPISRLGNFIFKNDGTPIDYFCCEIASFSPNGCGPCVSNIEGRWGMFDHDAKFLVWEKEDVERMVRILTCTDTVEDNLWPDSPIPSPLLSTIQPYSGLVAFLSDS